MNPPRYVFHVQRTGRYGVGLFYEPHALTWLASLTLLIGPWSLVLYRRLGGEHYAA